MASVIPTIKSLNGQEALLVPLDYRRRKKSAGAQTRENYSLKATAASGLTARVGIFFQLYNQQAKKSFWMQGRKIGVFIASVTVLETIHSGIRKSLANYKEWQEWLRTMPEETAK